MHVFLPVFLEDQNVFNWPFALHSVQKVPQASFRVLLLLEVVAEDLPHQIDFLFVEIEPLGLEVLLGEVVGENGVLEGRLLFLDYFLLHKLHHEPLEEVLALQPLVQPLEILLVHVVEPGRREQVEFLHHFAVFVEIVAPDVGAYGVACEREFGKFHFLDEHVDSFHIIVPEFLEGLEGRDELVSRIEAHSGEVENYDVEMSPQILNYFEVSETASPVAVDHDYPGKFIYFVLESQVMDPLFFVDEAVILHESPRVF